MEINQVLEQRGKTHGDYSVHAEVTQRIKAAINYGLDKQGKNRADLPSWMVESVDMIAHKLGRIAAGNPDFHDHWTDISGYAELAAKRCHDHPSRPAPDISVGQLCRNLLGADSITLEVRTTSGEPATLLLNPEGDLTDVPVAVDQYPLDETGKWAPGGRICTKWDTITTTPCNGCICD